MILRRIKGMGPVHCATETLDLRHQRCFHGLLRSPASLISSEAEITACDKLNGARFGFHGVRPMVPNNFMKHNVLSLRILARGMMILDLPL
jgi:hypothetical protein